MGDEEVAATVNELQTQMTAIQAALEGNAQSGLFRQAPFCGGPNENVHEWLTKFERLSKFYNWSNAKKLGALPLLLGGTALAWFQTLPDETINDFATLTDELKTRFGAQNLEFIFRQELYARKQGQNEPLSMYTEDVIRKCQRLSLSDNDMMNVFINGLNNEIKTHVILNQPKSFAEAENPSRLRNAVGNSTGFSNTATATAQAVSQEQKIKELEGQVNLLMTLAAQRKDPNFSAKPVQAFEAKTPSVVKKHTNPFLPFSAQHQSECGSEIASAKQEIIAAFESRFQGNQVPKGRGKQHPGVQNVSRGRNLRTTDGQPICNSCQRVGHVSKYCSFRSQFPVSPPSGQYQHQFQPQPSFQQYYQQPPFQQHPPFQQQPRFQSQSNFGGKNQLPLNGAGSSQWGN